MKEQWIIGVCNTEGDGVDLIGFCGTEDEVKKRLVILVKDDAKNDDMDYGTESVGEVCIQQDGSLYAYGCYSDYHIPQKTRMKHMKRQLIM